MTKEQLDKLTAEYQALQEQIQSLSVQKAQFGGQKEELKEAASELEKAKGRIYSSIGGVIIEATKDDAQKSIKEKQESIEMRLNIINRQYDEAIKREKSLRSEIENMLKGEKQ